MAMLMMGIRNVGMAVRQGSVPVPVRMRLARRVVRTVRVPMMLVVTVGMRMGLSLVNMSVFMMLGDMQPYTHAHQTRGSQKLGGDRLPQANDGRRGTKERGGREVGPGSGRAQAAQGAHEQG
jgi:hypothetical protein